MTAPADIDVLKIFIAECEELDFGEVLVDPEAEDIVRKAMLWMTHTLLRGERHGWVDLGYHSNAWLHERYAPARKFFDRLQCRPLLEPWLRGDVRYTEQNIAELKAIHMVTTELKDKT